MAPNLDPMRLDPSDFRFFLSEMRNSKSEEPLDFSYLDQSGEDLNHLILRGVVLDHANFYKCDLTGAKLQGASLNYADLTEAILRFARLSNAISRHAKLRRAILHRAKLCDAILSQADLREAVLTLRRPAQCRSERGGRQRRRFQSRKPERGAVIRRAAFRCGHQPCDILKESRLIGDFMMNESKEIEIKPAKGRPFLHWVGKQPLQRVTAFPAQLVEAISAETGEYHLNSEIWGDWATGFPRGGLLFHGDNKDVLAHLLANGFRGKVKLIYIDPPFDSGADYIRRVSLRGIKDASKIEGEIYSLGEQIQYTDIWTHDNYLQFMYERLLLLKELLSNDGSIYLHCDWHRSHLLRCLMDEVFGVDNILNEIIWKRTSARSDSKTYNHIHDTILFYGKSKEIRWNKLLLPHPEKYLERYYNYQEANGRRFMALNLTADGKRKGSSGMPWRGFDPNSLNNHWKYAIDTLEKLDSEGRIYWPDKEGGWPRLKKYLDETKGRVIQSIWDDVYTVNSQAEERTDYPTQKSEDLVRRIVKSSTFPGDIVLDCFIGSGTTTAVAQKLGRRWIGCDLNKGAIQTTLKRLQGVMQEQAEWLRQCASQPALPELGAQDAEPEPAQLSFAVYRVNDYDLQIQHNEAVNLACEHLGVTRTKTDRFFDGALGKKLVKIVPFNHPLTPLDLEEVKKELASRPDETRDVLVVCLGKELAADAWLTDWNRLRKATSLPNQIEAVELRSDPRYGGFFQHEPAQADVSIRREAGEILVKIQTFISPTILQRLQGQSGVLTPHIEDWRSMVDSVMIDLTYDGEVFNIFLADVPEKKDDLVQGSYALPAPKGETTVAVKITDMLGEEVLVTRRLSADG